MDRCCRCRRRVGIGGAGNRCDISQATGRRATTACRHGDGVQRAALSPALSSPLLRLSAVLPTILPALLLWPALRLLLLRASLLLSAISIRCARAIHLRLRVRPVLVTSAVAFHAAQESSSDRSE